MNICCYQVLGVPHAPFSTPDENVRLFYNEGYAYTEALENSSVSKGYLSVNTPIICSVRVDQLCP